MKRCGVKKKEAGGMKKTFRLHSCDEVDEALRCWGDKVISKDRLNCTVTVDIEAEELKEYEYYHEIDNIDI
jgi:hypothetical protein